jgi:AbrB family looped-hinge helix DNA binding protein
MAAATLTDRGQIVIPAEIRAKYGLTPGTQVEFVDDGQSLRLVVRRRVTPSDPHVGYGMVKVPSAGRARRLAEFDAAAVARTPRRRTRR